MDTKTNEADAPELPEFPLATVVTSMLAFFFFAGLVYMTYYFSTLTDVVPPTITGEQKLSALKASQEREVTSYNFDKATNNVRVPVDVAMKKLAEVGTNSGKLPFPLKPAAPVSTPAPVPTPAMKEAPKEPAKQTPAVAPKADVKIDAKKDAPKKDEKK